MLSPKQRRAFVIRKVVPKERKGLGYQIAVIFAVQSSDPPISFKDNEDDLGDEESEFVMPGKATPKLEREAKPPQTSYRMSTLVRMRKHDLPSSAKTCLQKKTK